MLLLAVALASTTASARSCVVRCPGQPASCSTCTSSGPLWAPSWTNFSDGVPEDLHHGVLEGSLGDLLDKFCQGHSITIEFWALLTEFYQWGAPSTPGEAPPCDDFSDFCTTSQRCVPSTTSPRLGEGLNMVGGTREEHNTSVYMLSVPLNDCGTAKAVSGGAPFWAAFSDIFTASPLGVPSTTSPRLGEGLGMVGGTREEHNTSLYMLSVPLNDCGTAKAVEGGGANASGLPRNQSVNWLSSRDGGVPCGEELQASYFSIGQFLHYTSAGVSRCGSRAHARLHSPGGRASLAQRGYFTRPHPGGVGLHRSPHHTATAHRVRLYIHMHIHTYMHRNSVAMVQD